MVGINVKKEKYPQFYKKEKALEPTLPRLLLVGSISDYMLDIKEEFDTNIVNIPFQNNYILKMLVRKSCGLIFPSFYEGFGLLVIEAFSQGINVACSNTTSLPEIANEHAILFDPYNVDGIRDSIIELSHRDNQEQILRDYAAEFTYDREAEQYMNLIRSLVR